jgi:two-component system, OmpR family, phosphate regulon response regulator OmpR
MRTHPPRIHIVDDDARMRSMLETYLREQEFAVSSAADGRFLERTLSQHQIDLVVLDLMLPGEDGLSLCRRLRAAGTDVPIIMLTAKGDDVDRIVGLEIGADDYIPKPFNPRELVARIKVVLRRRPAVTNRGAPAPDASIVRFGRCQLDLGTRMLTKDGQTVALTTGEFAVLEALIRHPRQTLSRERLMELARGREAGVFDRSMDVQISRIRRLVEEEPAAPRYIQTVRGIGYVFVPGGSDT